MANTALLSSRVESILVSDASLVLPRFWWWGGFPLISCNSETKSWIVWILYLCVWWSAWAHFGLIGLHIWHIIGARLFRYQCIFGIVFGYICTVSVYVWCSVCICSVQCLCTFGAVSVYVRCSVCIRSVQCLYSAVSVYVWCSVCICIVQCLYGAVSVYVLCSVCICIVQCLYMCSAVSVWCSVCIVQCLYMHSAVSVYV